MWNGSLTVCRLMLLTLWTKATHVPPRTMYAYIFKAYFKANVFLFARSRPPAKVSFQLYLFNSKDTKGCFLVSKIFSIDLKRLAKKNFLTKSLADWQQQCVVVAAANARLPDSTSTCLFQKKKKKSFCQQLYADATVHFSVFRFLFVFLLMQFLYNTSP